MDDKVDVLLGGADDYVVKPFEIREVLARVQVQLRKSSGAKETKVLEHNGLLLDREEHQIYVDGVRLEGVTRQEFLILELFLSWPKKVFSKEEIFEAAWEEPFMGETKAIDVHISNIRKKLKQYRTGRLSIQYGESAIHFPDEIFTKSLLFICEGFGKRV